MKKWRKYPILIFLLACIVLFAGCSRTRIIDKISIIHVFGFDLAENGDLIGTALFPDYTKSKSSDEIRSLEEQAESGVLFVPKMAKHTSTPVELAKIRVMVFGQEYAKAGIGDMVERFIITPQLGTHIHIAVSEHSARETLNLFKNEKSLTLAERIEHNMISQAIPRMNLHVFLNHFYGEGMDPFVPMLTLDDKDRVMVEGVGIFKDDKFKLHLSPKQAIIFSLIKDEHTQATYNIELDDDNRKENLTVRAFRSRSKWDWDQKKKDLNLGLHLQMTLTQFPTRFSSEKVEDITEMKKLIVRKLKTEIEDLLLTLKENEVDPIGIGNIIRSKDRTWKEASFYELYPTLPIHVNLTIEIIHSGLES